MWRSRPAQWQRPQLKRAPLSRSSSSCRSRVRLACPSRRLPPRRRKWRRARRPLCSTSLRQGRMLLLLRRLSHTQRSPVLPLLAQRAPYPVRRLARSPASRLPLSARWRRRLRPRRRRLWRHRRWVAMLLARVIKCLRTFEQGKSNCQMTSRPSLGVQTHLILTPGSMAAAGGPCQRDCPGHCRPAARQARAAGQGARGASRGGSRAAARQAAAGGSRGCRGAQGSTGRGASTAGHREGSGPQGRLCLRPDVRCRMQQGAVQWPARPAPWQRWGCGGGVGGCSGRGGNFKAMRRAFGEG